MNHYGRRMMTHFSGLNRRRKWRLFCESIGFDSGTSVLDVGFNAHDLEDPYVNFIEKVYPYPERLTALGLEDSEELRRVYPGVTVVTYDGGEFPFEDQSFDVVWSNAVLEHVGGRSRQLAFLREIRRVGRRAFLSTPNRRFPVEVHTGIPLLHLLPHPVYDRLMTRMGKTWAATPHICLLTKHSLRRLVSEAGFASFQMVPNRLFGLVLDFVVVAESQVDGAGRSPDGGPGRRS